MKINSNNNLEERLVSGESAIQTAVIHWGIYWPACVVLLFGVLLASLVLELGLLLIIVGFLMLGYAALKKSILMCVLTNKRVLVRYGILQVDVVDVHFDKIESIELERMLPGMVLGYANLVIMGTGRRYIVIPYVANGVEIRRAYNEMMLGDQEE